MVFIPLLTNPFSSPLRLSRLLLTNSLEKIGHILTWLTQGQILSLCIWHTTQSSSQLFRYRKGPHSPHHHRDPITMMWERQKPTQMEKDTTHFVPFLFLMFHDGSPLISLLLGFSIIFRSFYFSVYYFLHLTGVLPTSPLHFIMGPLHGFIVNWFGHWAGYRNQETPDKSKNTLPIDLFLMGELYQNNHHANPNDPCFAKKWWELDIGHLALMAISKNRRKAHQID